MGSRIENRVVLGSLRYKSSPDSNLLFQVPLVQTAKENIEFDRTLTVQLEQLYDDERQASTIFRPTCKISLLFKCSIIYIIELSLIIINKIDII